MQAVLYRSCLRLRSVDLALTPMWMRHQSSDAVKRPKFFPNPFAYFRYQKSRPVVPILQLSGMIQAGRGANRINLEHIQPLLERAFAFRNLAAVALVINSPGGSAAQSDLIRNEIRRQAGQRSGKVPVLAFVEDYAFSGGYYLACAADTIYGNRQSLVGSIGAVMAQFGLNKLLNRYDVEWRPHTAGKRKLWLSPFQPETEEARGIIRNLLTAVHKNFIAVVKEARGAKLKEKATELFEGDVWPADQAKDLGLIDEIGDLHAVVHEKFGPHVRLIRMKRKMSINDVLERFSASGPSGMQMAGPQLLDPGSLLGLDDNFISEELLRVLIMSKLLNQ